MKTTSNIAARVILIGVVIALAMGAALLRGGSLGITFANGDGFNLTIDSHAIYNGVLVPGSTWDLKNLVPGSDKFFNFGDVKPGDHGETTISFHVNKDAWMCLDFKNLKDKENGENEPESHEDTSRSPTDGELAEGLEFFAWHDDGDDIFEQGERTIFGTSVQSGAIVLKNKTYALAEYGGGAPFTASSTRYIGISWCAGNLAVNLATANISCDGAALGNEAQTDSMSVDISVRAVPKSDQPKFKCGGGTTGLGEEIGKFVKCETIAKIGWPLPRYETECPNGFGSSTSAQSVPRSGSTRAR